VSLGVPAGSAAAPDCFGERIAGANASSGGLAHTALKKEKGARLGWSGSAQARDPRDRPRRHGANQNVIELTVRKLRRDNVHSFEYSFCAPWLLCQPFPPNTSFAATTVLQ